MLYVPVQIDILIKYQQLKLMRGPAAVFSLHTLLIVIAFICNIFVLFQKLQKIACMQFTFLRQSHKFCAASLRSFVQVHLPNLPKCVAVMLFHANFYS